MAKSPVQTAKGLLVIQNAKGLHSRPSTELVKCATKFKSQIKLNYQNHAVDAKSLWDLLLLGAPMGAEISVEITGEDCKEAMFALIELARNNFYMHY